MTDETFQVYLAPGLIALVVTLTAAPVVRRAAVALELYDKPDAGLKPHDRPIPYLGGVAMYLGWLGALLFAAAAIADCRSKLLWTLAGGSVLMLTGLIDDIRHVRPRLRLLIQAVVAGLLLCGGIGRGVAVAFLGPLSDWVGAWVLTEPVLFFIGSVVCVLILAGATNATNLIDGLDGLCAGVVGIAGLGFLLISAHLDSAAPSGDAGDAIRTVLAVALVGACLGFLRHNFNPASLIMGDSVSLLLGFNVAVLMILFAENASWRWFAASLLAFAFPIFDTALAIARRWLNDRPLFVGDRSHFYDQLRDRGLSVRQTVLLCYGLGLVLAALGAILPRLPIRSLLVVFVASPALAAVVCWRLGMLRVDNAAERSDRALDGSTGS